MQRLPVTFVLHSGAEFTVTMADVSSLGLFMQDPEPFRAGRYEVQSHVSSRGMSAFINRLTNKPYQLDEMIVLDIEDLCHEFDFPDFLDEVQSYLANEPKLRLKTKVRSELADLANQVEMQERTIDDITRWIGDVQSTLRSEFNEATVQLKHEVASHAMFVTGTQALKSEIQDLRGMVEDLRSEVLSLRRDLTKKNAELVECRNEISALRTALDSAKLPKARVTLEVPFDRNSFEGLFWKLRQECGGRIDERGMITIVARDELQQYQAGNLVDGDPSTLYASQNIPKSNPWVLIDLKGRVLRLTHYSLRSAPYDPGRGHIKQWQLLGASDSRGFFLIDEHKTDDFNGRSIERTFIITQPVEITQIKLVMSGPNQKGEHSMVLSGFEVFGTVTMP